MSDENLRPCYDCDVPPGTPHLDGCDVARCTVCGWQRLGCDHGISDEGRGEIWTGLWPGTEECEEYDLWSYFGPPWIPCSKDHPSASHDLNTLAEWAATGRATWNGSRWVKV